MASISDERLREMEEEMDRFEAEIEGPQGGRGRGGGFILGSNTFDRVQAQLTAIRQDMSSSGSRSSPRESNVNQFGDEDFRQSEREERPEEKEDGDEFYDIDERPGRPQGPPIGAPPPPPPPPGGMPPHGQGPEQQNRFAPPPPPPPEPQGNQHLHPPGLAPPPPPPPPRPAFMPPQLRHRPPRPPFPPRPPQGGMVRMGPPGGHPPPPPPHHGPGQFHGGPPRGPPMMGPPGGPPMGMPGPMPPQQPMPGPMMGPPAPPGMEGPPGQFMTPSMEAGGPPGQIVAGPVLLEQSKVIYAAAPVITVERKKEEKKKKKKKKKEDGTRDDSAEAPGGSEAKSGSASSSAAKSNDGDSSIADMEVAPASSMTGGIEPNMMAQPFPMGGPMGIGGMVNPMGAPMMMGGMVPQGMPGAVAATGVVPGTANPGKKEKKKKEKKFLRLAASTTWEDQTLAEWEQDDFRMFCGDLGNEVTDETLVRAFNKYPSFLKAKVVRDRRTNKTKGYGFVSFKDPLDFTRAMREMNGKYVGNRPIKLRKSTWKDRSLEVVRKKDKEKKRLGLK